MKDHIEYVQSLDQASKDEILVHLISESNNRILTYKGKNGREEKLFRFPHLFSMSPPSTSIQQNWNYFSRHVSRILVTSLLSFCCGGMALGVILFAKMLYTIDKQAFERSMDEFHRTAKTFSVIETKALEMFANLTTTQRIAINRFFHGKFGWSLFPYEAKCSAYWKKLMATMQMTTIVITYTEEKTNEERTVTYLYNDLLKLLQNHLHLLQSSFTSVERIGKRLGDGNKVFPIILAGDYGNEYTKIIASFVSCEDDGQQFPYPIAIYKGKENYQILKKILSQVNDAIKLWKTKKVSVLKSKSNSTIRFALVEDTFTPDIETEELFSMKFDFFLTGDLSFQFLLQGREHFATGNCLLCKSRKNDWKVMSRSEDLTHNKIKELGRAKKKYQNFGFEGRETILSEIEIDHCICPILHIELGIVTLLNESIYIFNKINIEREWKELTDIREAIRNEQYDLFCLERLRDNLKGSKSSREEEKEEEAKQEDEDYDHLEMYEFTQPEKMSIENFSQDLNLEEISSQIQNKKTKTRQLLEKEQKCYNGNSSKTVHNQLEKLQRKYKIVRQAYHTNQLTGEHCHRFLKHNEEMSNEIKSLFKSSSPAIKGSQIDEFISKLQQICKVLDGLFLYVFRQGVVATDDECNDVDQLCSLFGKLWRDFFNGKHITPKVHLLESHIPVQFRALRSLGEFTEESIERQHHLHKTLMRRFTNILQEDQKQELIHGTMLYKNHPDCKDAIATVINATKRDKSKETQTKQCAKQKRLQARQESMRTVLETVVIDDIRERIHQFL